MLLEVFCVNFAETWELKKNLGKGGEKKRMRNHVKHSNPNFHMLKDLVTYHLNDRNKLDEIPNDVDASQAPKCTNGTSQAPVKDIFDSVFSRCDL